MSKTFKTLCTGKTLRIMAGVETGLNTLIRLEVCARGYEENVRRASIQYKRLMLYLEREIDRLVKAERPTP